MNRRDALLSGLALTALISTPACAQTKPSTSVEGYDATVFAEGIEQPWGMAFLPDGRLLVTEKAGTLKLISADGNSAQVITGTPEVVDYGQAGLLDVAIDPKFSENGLVYLSFSEAGEGDTAGTAIARGKLEGTALTGTKVIWQQSPKVEGPNHWGSRLAFSKDGQYLFATLGERASYRDKVQDLGTTFGKTIRIKPDGSIPQDNPFVKTAGAKPEIWSYGHRNMQGGTIHPVTGEFWTNEHGPQGGDEINIARAGKNYGWPLVTYGEEYGGGRIGVKQKAGMEEPLHYWVPSIAPSGMWFYDGPHAVWQGKLFIGSLKFKYLDMITLDGEKVVKEEKLLTEFRERIRDVVMGPDGALYVAFDNADGRIVRIVPKGA
ncbi:PQQ-dependent sugar dehydrogenase [Asticcacaulis sp. BYS171W]|uniref:PQQ-dependent sugar dehydrogenase n=1 Tax=Asticcacaulis aquaticus TaxID=2984212 RepID=A0ABT5HSC3_9CAUL|nr:PQQ-dependent sugar dehydrogenase [Asticcacaulis aquaticus]MDC7682965.1 PQQ-dependent sugar dehydrogenase [Asticcacaulis aquaticus]